MDTSPDASGDSSRFSKTHSDHATPSSNSNKASSHTSFSPQNFDDSTRVPYTSSSSGVSPNIQNTMFQPNNFGQGPTQLGAMASEGPAGMNTPFSMPANWDFSNDGPAQTSTGLTPHNPNNISQSSGLTPGPTGMTPISMPDWQGVEMPNVGEAWMYGDWLGSTPQPQ